MHYVLVCLSLPLLFLGILCIQDCGSGCSDNHVGCTGARLYKRGNSGDIQTGVRGPSINLTGWRSCQEYERMLWSMLSQWACVLLRPYRRFLRAPPERLALAEQPVYVHLPVCVCNHREALFGPCTDQLGSEPKRGERGRHYSPALPSDCLPHCSLRKSV